MGQMLHDRNISLEDFNGDNSFELPVPATYVVDTDGQIKYAYVEPDYTKRADPVDIIGALRRLRQ
jgi:peroxiredoxin